MELNQGIGRDSMALELGIYIIRYYKTGTAAKDRIKSWLRGI